MLQKNRISILAWLCLWGGLLLSSCSGIQANTDLKTALSFQTIVQEQTAQFRTFFPQTKANQTGAANPGAAYPGAVADSQTSTGEGGDDILVIEEIVIGLLLIATIVGIIARQLRVPYTVGLVLIGLVLAFVTQIKIHIPPNLILGLLVPPLIFEAAFHLNLSELRRNLPAIIVLAVPGVILTTLLVGGLVAWGTGLALPVAMVFGALVSATDPIAVIALFKRLGAPKRLQVLLEGESIFNDGTAIVIYGLVVGGVLDGHFSLVSGIIQFFIVAGGGLTIGAILGTLISNLISRIDDYLIETTLTTILAFGSYLLAEAVGVSGVLAVVAAGLINGNVGPRGMSPTTRIIVFNFWEYAGFLANSFIFLLIGLQIDLSEMLVYWQPIIIAIIAVLMVRAATIYGLSWIGGDIPLKWQHVLYWGGLRGAIALALALSLPSELGPSRPQLQVMAFSVVLFTLVVQGFTMDPLVKRLRLVERLPLQDEYERRHARAVAARASYEHLGRMRKTGLLSDHSWQILSPILARHSQNLIEAVKQVFDADPSMAAEELNTARREALRAQKSALNSLLQDGIISDETYTQLVSEIDLALTASKDTWSELVRQNRAASLNVNRLMTAVIQEADFDNVVKVLAKMDLVFTHLTSSGGFLGRRNVTLLIGFTAGQEENIVNAFNLSCRQRVEYVTSPLEGGLLPIGTSIPVTVGGATIFTFEVDRFVEF